MAKKGKKRIATSKRVTNWSIGQPLVFPKVKTPTENDTLAQNVVGESMRHPFKSKRQRRKKK
jgi:hypothetical protein